eukprot:g16528.t1
MISLLGVVSATTSVTSLSLHRPQPVELTLNPARSLSWLPALTTDYLSLQPPAESRQTAWRSTGPAQPDPIRGPSRDHHRKPSLSLSPPIPETNLTKIFPPTWTLTLIPALDPQPGLAQPDPIQGPRPDHH